jgi:hypothetical protein
MRGRTVVAVAFLLLACGLLADRRRSCCNGESLVVIDVAELYTPEAVAINANDPRRLETKIRAAVALANSDFANSELPVRLRLVHVGPKDFGGLRDFELLQAAWTDAGVAQLRDDTGADLVGIWHDGSAGHGLMPMLNSPNPAAFVHVIPAGQPADAWIYSHEILHQLGVSHADGICRTQEPAFRDVIADCADAGMLPPLWRGVSNPAVTYLGVPTGDQDHDGAAIVRIAAPVVASYRQAR